MSATQPNITVSATLRGELARFVIEKLAEAYPSRNLLKLH